MKPPIPVEERFWRYVDKRGPDECWSWTGARTGHGYGQITNTPGEAPTQLRAHRVAWAIHHGPIPAGTNILHACNNKLCVNATSLRHVYSGTQYENMADYALTQGRELLPIDGAVLREARELRAAGLTYRQLGIRLGVHYLRIFRALRAAT